MANFRPELSLSGVLDEDLLRRVTTTSFGDIPDDLPDEHRFIVSSIRAATQASDMQSLCVFVYSEAAMAETSKDGFTRIAHMQDGHGSLSGSIIATNHSANNGMLRRCEDSSPEEIINELEGLELGERCAVFWDPTPRVATIYPKGVSDFEHHLRVVYPSGDTHITRDEIVNALDITYEKNLKNTSGHTIRLWSGEELIRRAEDELERHIKGQLTMYFAGYQRKVIILAQTSTAAGRSDLIFVQHLATTGPNMAGVLELKVLRGPETNNIENAREGLSQGYFYRQEVGLRFAILALYDVARSPSSNVSGLLEGQCEDHIAKVLVRRYPIYNSPHSWRQAGGPGAPTATQE